MLATLVEQILNLVLDQVEQQLQDSIYEGGN